MSSISSIGSNSASMMQGMRPRPDATKMAEELFSKLDSSGQGSLSKADFQSALDSTASTSTASSDVDDLFSQLDTDSDGSVTKQEFTDALKQLSDQMDQQFESMRMQQAMQGGGAGGMGGMPPPPPDGGDDSGFTQEELSSQLSEIGSSDSTRSTMISNIVDNFDEADTDSDGKVSFKEAMAFDQSTSTSTATSSSSSSSSSTSSSTDANTVSSTERKTMMQIMQLMQAYNIGNDGGGSNNLLSRLSVSA